MIRTLMKIVLICLSIGSVTVMMTCDNGKVTGSDVEKPTSEKPIEPSGEDPVLPEFLKIFNQQAAVNIVVLSGSEGNLLIDSGWPDRKQDLKNKVNALNDGGIRCIIQTHHHVDHIGGLDIIDSDGVIIGHPSRENTYKTEAPGVTVQTVNDTKNMTFSGHNIQITDIHGGHTDADLMVHFPDHKIVYVGDVYLPGSFPSVDTKQGGNVKDLLKIYDHLLSILPEDVILIPGHGSISNVPEFREYVAQVKLMVQAIRDAMRDGATLPDLLFGDVLDPWEQYYIVSKTFWLTSVYRTYHQVGDGDN